MTGMTEPGLLVLDSFDGYEDIQCPVNIKMIATNASLRVGGTLRYVFDAFPHESYYGILSDDALPCTPNWDTQLARSAGSWRIACANDLYTFPRRAAFVALGGELVRALGSLVPDGFNHFYIDDVWETIGRRLHLFNMHPDIVIEHLHFTNNKAAYDETYEHRGSSVVDQKRFVEWLQHEAEDTLNRIRNMRDDV